MVFIMTLRLENITHSYPNSNMIFEAYDLTFHENFDESKIIEICSVLSGNRDWRAYSDSCKLNHSEFPSYEWYIEVGFIEGIKDPLAETIKNILHGINVELKYVSTYKIYCGKGAIPENVSTLYNPTVNNIRLVHPAPQFIPIIDKGITTTNQLLEAKQVQISHLTSNDLEILSSKMNLGLSKEYMIAVQKHFKDQNREPYDVELMSIAQTWCEHCKHIIFSSSLDDVSEGIYKQYIKGSTEKIIKTKPNFCVSVFSDNAGAVSFVEDWMITAKVETHNSPSAIEPFGGAMTGILGVNRDILGFGLGAQPILNSYAFCFGDPEKQHGFYRGKQSPALSNKQIVDGVIKGVEVGGNCAGIPTSQGLVYFNDSYSVTPLVYVGSLGILKKSINGIKSFDCKPNNNDLIVIIGGRTGRDGIFGSVCSSSSISSDTPGSIVQIGDPITQKKLSDALVREIRDLNLYNAITDNGAGGLSSSIGEMGKKGFKVNLEKVLLKYTNMEPWEIWISESQERMTIAVDPSNLDKLSKILETHEVEYSVIGEFNESGRGIVSYFENIIMDLSLDFLHEGYPRIPLKTASLELKPKNHTHEECDNLKDAITKLFMNKNYRSRKKIIQRYDHEVQGNSAIKPMQNGVCGDVTVIRPIFDSNAGVISSQGIGMLLSDEESPYHMAGMAIDDAIRSIVAAGGDIDRIALLDNFCWSSSKKPSRLWQLKLTAMACHDYSISFETPFISGKDSMFNNFKGFDKNGNNVQIEAPPTLLVSGVGIIDNILKCLTFDVKNEGDILCYIKIPLINHESFQKPHINLELAKNCYKKFNQSVELFSSAISTGKGGIPYALCRKLMAGKMGARLSNQDTFINSIQYTPGFLVTINPNNHKTFLNLFNDFEVYDLGVITTENKIITKFDKIDLPYYHYNDTDYLN